jgi:hypothetical protein
MGAFEVFDDDISVILHNTVNPLDLQLDGGKSNSS